MGRTVVRTIRVLPVGAIEPARRHTGPDSAGTANQAPVKTRETASAGYRATLGAALTHRRETAPADPYTVEAIARQEAALRAGRQHPSEHREAIWAEADAASGPAPGSVEESLARARAYARQQRAGGSVPRRVFDVA